MTLSFAGNSSFHNHFNGRSLVRRVHKLSYRDIKELLAERGIRVDAPPCIAGCWNMRRSWKSLFAIATSG